MELNDTPRYYGLVSRTLHWAMAALFLWQFGGMALKSVVGRGPLMKFWVGSHGSVGTLLLTLLIARAIWAFVEHRRRPPYPAGLLGRAARLGHLALYTLMLVVPSLALLRAFGSGKGMSVFGIPLQAPGGAKVDWMTAPANLFHGTLAWVLLALIAGHVAMVCIHRFWFRDDVLHRMAGRVPAEVTA